MNTARPHEGKRDKSGGPAKAIENKENKGGEPTDENESGKATDEHENKSGSGKDTDDHDSIQSGGVDNSNGPYISELCFLAAHVGMENVTLHQHDARQKKRHSNIIPDTWILLHSQSMVSFFKNPNFLRDIQPSSNTLPIYV